LEILPKPTLGKVLTELQGRNFYRATEQCTENNEVMNLRTSLRNFEVFICEFEELLSTKNFNEVRKRIMILPFTLSYVRREHHVPNKHQTELIPVIKNEVNIDLMVLRMSYQDALLLNNTIQYQLQHLHKENNLTKETHATDNASEFSATAEISPEKRESIRGDYPSPRLTCNTEELKEEKNNHVEVIDVQSQIENQDNWESHLEEFNIGCQGIQIVKIKLYKIINLFRYLLTMPKVHLFL